MNEDFCKKRRKYSLNNLTTLFFYFTLWELILCGSGQLLQYHNLTIRMINFLIVIFISIFYLQYPIGKPIFHLLFAFFLIHILGILLSSLSNAQNQLLYEDIRPLSYFFVILFFYHKIKNIDTIKKVGKIIQWGAFVMAICYLVYIFFIKYIYTIQFDTFYDSMQGESDFMFRETKGEFFYKGFLYLPIGLLFFYNEKKIISIPSIIILIAIYFTLTRGFYVITFCGALLFFLLSTKINISNFFIGLILFTLSMLVNNYLGLFEVPENRLNGDAIRIMAISEVLEQVTPFSFIFGHGFGIGIPIRPVHMEMSFLEIFHKQGLLGILFWIFLLYRIIFYYKASIKKDKIILRPFLIGTILIYIQSFFNPYLNNSIGMSFVLLSYISSQYMYNQKFLLKA
jgi:hypothetical protein